MNSTSIAFVKGLQTGTAFGVGPRHLITSLHVVGNKSNVDLQFPDANGNLQGPLRTAAVAFSMPDLDVALLRTSADSEPIPPGRPLAPFPDVQGHYFEILGFPESAGRNLTHLSGRLRIRRPVRLNDYDITTFQADPSNHAIQVEGFSGAPVYAPFLGGVVAIFAGYYPTAGIHFAVPIVEILKRLPDDIVASIDCQVLPHLKQTGVSRTYSELTFCSIVESDAWVHALESDSPSIVRLLGPSGIGKSSHASAWAEKARSDGHIVLWADVARDGGLGQSGNVSAIKFLFNALTPTQSSHPDTDRDTVLHQIKSAIDEQKILNTNTPHLIIVVDALEALNDRSAFWSCLIRELLSLKSIGIASSVLCCERSEFSEVVPVRVAEEDGISLQEVVIRPLTNDEVIRVYENGYRKAAYPWLPPADELPLELLDLCRIPMFIKYVINTIKQMEMNQTIYAGDVLRNAISHTIDQACDDILGQAGRRLVRDSLREAIAATIMAVSHAEGFVYPPQRAVKTRSLVISISRILNDLGLDYNIANPHDILTALSRVGFLDSHGDLTSISSDILYEFQIARVYADLAGKEHDGQPVDSTRLQSIFNAIHSHSLDNVTPPAVNEVIERLLSLPPCRETFALRFIEYAIDPPVDSFVVQFSFDLRLLQIIREYCESEHQNDLELDDTLYSAVEEQFPTLIPEVALAFPMLVEHDEENSTWVVYQGAEKQNQFHDFPAWIRMRRAIFLLLVMAERRLATLQHLATSLDTLRPNDDYSIRLALLANSILSRNSKLAIQAYRLGQVTAITYLLSFVPYILTKRKGKTSVDAWPEWLHRVAAKILPNIPLQIKIDDKKVEVGPSFFFLSALRVIPEKAVKALSDALRDADKEIRMSCLRFCELVIRTVEHNLPPEVCQRLKEIGEPVTVTRQFAPSLREELLVHANRPGVDGDEREFAKTIAEQLWDGSSPAEYLPANPAERPYSLAHSIKKNLSLGRTPGDVVDFFRTEISKSQDAIQQALDSFVVCLALIAQLPSEWKTAWDAVGNFILQIDEIRAMVKLIEIATQAKETRPGERYEAIHLLLLPFGDLEIFSEDAYKKAIHVERWAQSQIRFPEEAQIIQLIHVGHDLQKRGDFRGAIECAHVVIESSAGHLMQVDARLLLIHAMYGLEDEQGTLSAISELEKYGDSVEKFDLDVLVLPNAMGKYEDKMRQAQIAQIHTRLWRAKELRAEMNRMAGNLEGALADLVATRKEALSIGAWWPAFRGLERECEIYDEQGNSEASLVAVRELEQASDNPVPCFLGKMQRAVLLSTEACRTDDRATLTAALSLLDEVHGNIYILKGRLPDRELEGFDLWLGGKRVECLRALKRHDEAIAAAQNILEISRRLEEDKSTSNSMRLLQLCQESATLLNNALETAQERFAFCRRIGKKFDDDAAEAAKDAGVLLSRMAIDSSSKEAAELAIHWLGVAAKAYDDFKKPEIASQFRKDIEWLRMKVGIT